MGEVTPAHSSRGLDQRVSALLCGEYLYNLGDGTEFEVGQLLGLVAYTQPPCPIPLYHMADMDSVGPGEMYDEGRLRACASGGHGEVGGAPMI